MKAKTFLMLVLTTFMTQSFAASAQKEIRITGFHKLTVTGHVKVVLTEGDEPAVTMEGNQRAIDATTLTQNGDALEIINSNDEVPDITVYVTAHELSTIELQADAELSCTNVLHSPSISVMLSGNGDVKLKSDAQRIVTMSTGKGRICIEGDFNSSVTRMDSYNRLITAYAKN